MNKTRIIGLILMAVGIAINYSTETPLIDNITAGMVGIGIGLLLTGRVTKPAI